MRRRTLAVLTSLLLGAGLLSATVPATADPGGPSLPPTAAERAAERTLEVAQRVLQGRADGTAPSATLALRDLTRVLPRLSAAERAEAQRLLARPTDGARDRYGDGYRRKAVRRCSGVVCVHHVPQSSRYADPDEVSGTWAQRNLDVLTRTWHRTTGDLGYRKPLADGTRGGDRRFDVYLKDIGAYGLYGYCAIERRASNRRLGIAYCVLDEDFAKSQFGGSPGGNLRVTAAHEFFHAVQFAYDAFEDGWMMEATSTWIEERLADGVNDNRQFIPAGQLGAPAQALDYMPYDGYSARPYGNWVWFEHLSHRFGRNAVRALWWRAAEVGGAPGEYSVEALSRYLAGRGGLPERYAEFAVRNSVPRTSYPEGGAYRPQPVAGSKAFDGGGSFRRRDVRIQHLASRTYRLTPRMTSGRWRFTVKVDGPAAATSPQAVALVERSNGKTGLRRIALDADGKGVGTIAFDGGAVRHVYVSLVNASTRYHCGNGGEYACEGTSRDDGRAFTLDVRLRAE